MTSVRNAIADVRAMPYAGPARGQAPYARCGPCHDRVRRITDGGHQRIPAGVSTGDSFIAVNRFACRRFPHIPDGPVASAGP